MTIWGIVVAGCCFFAWIRVTEQYQDAFGQQRYRISFSMWVQNNFCFRHATEEDLSAIARLHVEIFEGPFSVEERRTLKYRSLLQTSFDLLENHLFAQQKHHLPLAIFVASLPQSRRQVLRSLSSLGGNKYRSEEIVGSIEVGHWPKQQFQRPFPSMFLANLVVAAQYRRHRVATELISQAEVYVIKNQSLTYIHTALLSNNTPAYRLYERNGYQVEANLSLPTEFSHVVIMTKNLLQSRKPS